MERNRFTRRSFLALTTGALAAAKALGNPKPVDTETPTEQPVKKILVVGDYIKAGYLKRFETLIGNRAEVISPMENCGNSIDIVSNMEKWLEQYDPDVVLISSGFEDCRTIYYGSCENLVPKKYYAHNIKNILDFCYLFSTKAVPIWATATFISDDKHVAAKAKERDFTIFNDDVLEYNRAAITVCKKLKVPVVDLFNVMSYSNPDALVENDGYHLNVKGNDTIAKALADQVGNYL